MSREVNDYISAHLVPCEEKGKKYSGAIDDGGARISYGEGKADREPSTGKGRYDLVSPYAIRRLARWYELGSEKYGDRNWEKGIPFSRCVDSAKRHLDKFVMGMTDEDHLAAAMWNIAAIIHYEELGMLDLDDMPHFEDHKQILSPEYIKFLNEKENSK